MNTRINRRQFFSNTAGVTVISAMAGVETAGAQTPAGRRRADKQRADRRQAGIPRRPDAWFPAGAQADRSCRRHGMAGTSPLASQTGLDILKRGGIRRRRHCDRGRAQRHRAEHDRHRRRRLHAGLQRRRRRRSPALNASGRAPRALSLDPLMRSRNITQMPVYRHGTRSPCRARSTAGRSTLPWFEIFCGLLLLLGMAVRGAAVILLVMLASFTVAVVLRALAIREMGGFPFCAIKFDCGCGAGEVFVCRKLGENLLLMALSAALMFWRGHRFCVRYSVFKTV